MPKDESTPPQERANSEDKGSGIPKSAKDYPRLYDIRKKATGGFEAIMPGLVSEKERLVMGTGREHFEVEEDAERAVERAKKRMRIRFERWSLQKTFSKYFYRIDEMPDGTFHVTVPGLKNMKTGEIWGSSKRKFNSWDEAKQYYLQSREAYEELTHKPILEIKPSDQEKISFSDIDAFHPQVAPTEDAIEISPVMKKYLLEQEKVTGTSPSASTYMNTVGEVGWQKKLFSFVSRYLEGEGAYLLQKLQVEHLDGLTPKQAVELATGVVIDLTGYKWDDTKRAKDAAVKPEKTKADQQTVLQLLQDGLADRKSSDWKGNGVCRNFACAVKAVFEALKENQTRYSRLRNTYCLYEGGENIFAPKRERFNTLKMNKDGHAWNTFVTLSKSGAANAVIVDATWAKRNLETKEVENLDYTLTRMEPVVHAVAMQMPNNAPDKEEQLRRVLSYYQLKIEQPGWTGGHVSPEEERAFYVSRAVKLLEQQEVPGELPVPFLEAIEQCYQTIAQDADKTEIETLWKIHQKNLSLNFSAILRVYLREKSLSNYQSASFLFQDDLLQRVVTDELKKHKDFAKFIIESPAFRARMRELLPDLFNKFSPLENPDDALELRYLVSNSNGLRHFENTIWVMGKLSPKGVEKLMEHVRQSLRTLDPRRFSVISADLDDYQLVRRYDKLRQELKQGH